MSKHIEPIIVGVFAALDVRIRIPVQRKGDLPHGYTVSRYLPFDFAEMSIRGGDGVTAIHREVGRTDEDRFFFGLCPVR